MPIPPHVRARRAALSEIAKETKAVLPGILRQLPHLQAEGSRLYDLEVHLPELDRASAPPRFEVVSSSSSKTYGTPVKVLNEDTLDAAMMMTADLRLPTQQPTNTTTTTTTMGAARRVAVMNLASERQPGGGWLTGAVAQEEALCYRSSLALSLHARYYPLPPRAAVYARDVVVVRSSMEAGHRLLLGSTATPISQTPAAALPVVSVISVAGIRKPELRKVLTTSTSPPPPPPADPDRRPGPGNSNDEKELLVFRHQADRDLTKDKMRLTLRVAAREGHELLVLGALGCGAFHNPPGEVARCWREVLEEPEFGGGRWFREIWFAVLDKRNEGNFEVFQRVLGDRVVGKVVVQG